MKQDHRGLTLVEIIIVVAIMSIIIGMAGLGINFISGKPADECAQKIYYSLESSRTTSTGKYLTTYRLYQDGATNDIMMEEVVQTTSDVATARTTTSKMGNATVTVTYRLSDGSIGTIAGSTDLTLTFNRGTGGFQHVSGTSAYCEEIVVTKAATTRTITLTPPTGRIELD